MTFRSCYIIPTSIYVVATTVTLLGVMPGFITGENFKLPRR